jgi:Mycothiol maleylpyruvate isomerase N-terminal domain
VDAGELDAALKVADRALRPYVDADWSVPAGSLVWSCRRTAAHVAHDLLAYAGQVAGRADGGYLPMDLRVRDEATPARVLDVVAACGALLGRAVAAAPAADRGWHWGPVDPGGFAALGVNEVLVHAYDIGVGLKTGWRPPAELAAAVLARLFPEAPGGDPVDALLWCTGRIALPGRPRRTGWILKAAVN